MFLSKYYHGDILYLHGIIEIFLEMRKLKKEIMLKLETKICQMKIEKKKEYMRNYYCKKKLLNHLINRVEELESASLKINFNS